MSTVKKDDALAEAIRATLISANVSDANWEAANVVDALDDVARAIWCGTRRKSPSPEFGETRGTELGAIEFQARAIMAAGDAIASAILDLASAIREGRSG